MEIFYDLTQNGQFVNTFTEQIENWSNTNEVLDPKIILLLH